MTEERFIHYMKTEQESLRRFLLGLCQGNADMADDIAQEALVRAYVASGTFMGLAKFRTWLFRIAYNCYIDRHRTKDHTSISTASDEALSIPGTYDADESFRYQQLYFALDKLSEKEKACVVLHYFEDRSLKEISSILQIPLGTVKYHLSMGRQHLKQLLQ